MSNTTPATSTPEANALRSSSFASCVHFGASADASASATGPSASNGANAACAPPGDAAAPRTSRRSASSRIPFGASDAINAASSSVENSRRSSSVTSTLGFMTPTSFSRSRRERNSRDVKSRRTSAGSHSPMTQSWGPMSSGRSVTIRASSLFRVSCAADASTLSLSFPRSSSACSSSDSTDPYSWISLVAVFSPTPGTPGMLSEGSPFNATYSRYFDGGTPNRSSTPASSYRTMSEIPRRLNITVIPGARAGRSPDPP